MKKLAISAPKDEELYSYSTSLRCFGCSNVGEVVSSEDPNVSSSPPVFNPAHEIDHRNDQWYHERIVISSAIRGQSLGGRDIGL